MAVKTSKEKITKGLFKEDNMAVKASRGNTMRYPDGWREWTDDRKGSGDRTGGWEVDDNS